MSSDWKLRRIGDFATRVKEINAEAVELPPLSVTKDRGVMLQSEKFNKRIATDLRKYAIARKGQFAFDPMSLYYGALGRIGAIDVGLVSPDYVVFEVDETVDGLFLDYLLRSGPLQNRYAMLAEGGSELGKRRRVYWSVFQNISLHLPELREQKKIASIVSSLDDAVVAARDIVSQMSTVKKALTDELLTRGVPGRRRAYQETPIGVLPAEWRLTPLDACIAPGRPICYGILMPGTGHAGGVPVVKVKNIKDGTIDTRNLLLTSPELDAQYARSRLRSGDILLTIRGTTGRVARVPTQLDGANITQDTARLSPDSSVNRDYLFYCLQSAASQTQIKNQTRGQAVKGINIGDVRNLLVPLPSLDEQREIARTLEEHERAAVANIAELRALEEIRCAVASALLTGEIRVPLPPAESP